MTVKEQINKIKKCGNDLLTKQEMSDNGWVINIVYINSWSSEIQKLIDLEKNPTQKAKIKVYKGTLDRFIESKNTISTAEFESLRIEFSSL